VPETREEQLDVVIVGAGFAGLYTLHRMRQAGRSARIFEAAGGVGGTWYWNRYPGARCDVESLEYSYQFDEDLQQEWHWSERYSTQPEILEYLNHVCDRFDLRGDIRFDTRVTTATFDEGASRWRVRTDQGDDVSAQFVVMATGCLSSANTPDIDGLATFAGDVFHTGQWPHEPVDFSGKRVAVVGTGSSGIQAIPVIAEQAAELFVFQRTASYTMPSSNGPLDPDEETSIKADYAGFRARNSLMPAALGSQWEGNTDSVLAVDDDTRERAFEQGWQKGGFAFLRSYPDLLLSHEANKHAADFARAKIRSIVHDPAVAELLSPQIVVGCKRPCIDSGYYATFNLPHVHLVDVSTAPIDTITEHGLRVGDDEYEVDAIVFATGFDAMTGSLLRVDIRGRDGAALRNVWAAGPVTYLGLGVAGFPNLFTVSGPGSPSVLTNMVVSIEQHVNWIADCIDYLGAHGYRSIEATPEAQHAWVEHVNGIAAMTLFNDPGCNSWYLGANIPGKTRVFMPLIGFPPYVEKCDDVVANDYEGFALNG
jgi:cation diffusion facilitator CzcD-associated flavoprotein CzcO